MRRLIIALAVVLAGVTSAFAYDTPKALLEAIYFPYTQPDDYDWTDWQNTDFYSKALNGLFEKDVAETEEGDVGRIDFDVFIDAQDYDLSKINIGEAVITGDKATAEVTFTNFDQPEDLTYSLVLEDGNWKVDNIVSHNADSPWSLQDLLTAPL